MKTSEQLSSLFSHIDNESDYEEEKRIKKLKITRNEFKKCGTPCSDFDFRMIQFSKRLEPFPS